MARSQGNGGRNLSRRRITSEICRLVRRQVENGASVEIDGLGTFRPTGNGEVAFEPASEPRVFVAYVAEDLPSAERLVSRLREGGCSPWLDKQRLLPGQNWPRSIQHSIEASDFFVALFSRRALSKRGTFQAELRYALDCAARLPLDESFILPVRLEDCHLPQRITREFQYVDLFPDWEQGCRKLLEAIRRKRRTG